MSFIRYIFAPKTLPIGSVWVIEDEYENPFNHKLKYKVLDVKNGFVKYEVRGRDGDFISEDSTALRSFYAFYRKIKETE